jgi:hypothetical protein
MTVFHWIYLDWFPVMGVAISQTSGSVNSILSYFFFYLQKKRPAGIPADLKTASRVKHPAD